MKPSLCDAVKIARWTLGVWANLVFGPADKTTYVSRTGTR